MMTRPCAIAPIRALIAIAVLAFAYLGAVAARAADTHLLGDAEIMSLMNGATLALTDIGGSKEVLHHLHPITHVSEHGRSDVIMPSAWDVESGIWWVEEDQFCVLYHHIVTVRKRCFAVAHDGSDLRFIETRYEMPGHKILRPNQWVQSAKLSRPAPGAGDYQLLTDGEIVTLLNANYLNIKQHDGPNELIIDFQPVQRPGEHGRMFSHPVKGRGLATGTWWVEDEQFCVYYDHLVGVRKRCFSIARDGSGEYRIFETRWEQPGRIIERQHQWVPSAQLFPKH